jgi:flagellar basal-body rod protein FlgC
MSSFDISGYGLSAQRLRINLISANIANANTTRTAEGGPYRRKEAIFKEVSFENTLNQALRQNQFSKPNENYIQDPMAKKYVSPALSSVVVDKIVRDDAPFKLQFDPSHPDADENGYVSLPNINPVIEMADLIEATRAYQANVAAFQSTKSIAQSAIDMMKG